MSKIDIVEEFSAENFLQNYWQKKPLLLRGFVTDFEDPLSAEELAGLACEEYVESRLVTQFEAGKYQLQHGPFAEEDFTSLPTQSWTLLVQAVDQFVDQVSALKRYFDFIPHWRIDDVMISFAADGGSVGPHFDHYDVFLLQGSGQRRWKIGQRCDSTSPLRANSELGILQDFESREELILSAGDVLYIPPGFSHWGVGVDESLCYSIGFRAPSHSEMLEGFSDFLMTAADPGDRYQDDTSLPFKLGGEIDSAQLDHAYATMQSLVADREKFNTWFACYVTQVKYPELVQALETPVTGSELTALAKSGQCLLRNPSSRMAYQLLKQGAIIALFVDGAMVRFSFRHLDSITLLCREELLTNEAVCGLIEDAEIAELLCQLLSQGSLLIDESRSQIT